MSHELLIQNGQASMFYINEVPWHGLGTKLNDPATAREAIEAARLDWEVVKLPVTAGSNHVPVPHKYAIVRKSDDGADPVLGVVGKNYTPLQNRDAFRFFDPIVGQDAAIYHTAGALGDGERVWILAKLPGYIRVAGDDITEKYLLFSNSHDGKSSVQIKFTPVRVVCQNTLSLALNGSAYRISHLADIQTRLENAHKMLGLINTQYEAMEQSFKAMVRVKMNENRLREYLSLVYPNSKDSSTMKRVERDRDWSEYFFDQGRGNRLPKVAGSLWAAFNGVTEWLDHRQSRQNQNQRLGSAWFGGSALVKAKALSVAQNKMEAWN